MANSLKEKRYIRIEDWQGNYYFPEGSVGDSTAGKIMDASEASTDPESGATTYTQGEKNPDSRTTSGTAIIISTVQGSSPKVVYSTVFNNISFGKVAVSMRLSSSVGEGTDPILQAKCYCVDNNSGEESLISSTDFTGDDIGQANEFINLGFITDFAGVSSGSVAFKVQIYLLGTVDCVINFDNISASTALPATYAIKDQNGNVINETYVNVQNITSKGSSTQPIYFDEHGVAHPITYFDGTSKEAETASVAVKATKDQNGNVIDEFYASKQDLAGKGSTTKPVYFNASGAAEPITSYEGNAATATKLKTPRNITIGGTTKEFDGSGNVSFSIPEIGIPLPEVKNTTLVFK